MKVKELIEQLQKCDGEKLIHICIYCPEVDNLGFMDINRIEEFKDSVEITTNDAETFIGYHNNDGN